jgi:Dolichyl-phosphate-mannose-protein mannosyltransferase
MNWKQFFIRYPAEIFLFLAAFFIRFPFFFRDYIDKDESTFILMGQSIVDGHLPYNHLWDLKPPLLFYFFALIEDIFPHSFAAIRFFGVIIVFLSALLLMKIAKEVQLKNGFLIALLYVLLSSEFGSLQGVMSEHFAVFFLLAGFYFFMKEKNSFQLLAGIAFGCSILCKLNYGYALVALMILAFVSDWKSKGLIRAFLSESILAVGILIPIIGIAMPFILSGKIEIFLNSVFLAPMEYARALQYGTIEKLKITWWIITTAALISYAAIRFSERRDRKLVLSAVAILTGTIYSFYSSGIINGHYLVQVYPFVLMLLFGVILRRVPPIKWSVLTAIVFLLSFETVVEYYRLIRSLGNPAEYRPTFEVINELKKRKLEDDKIFFADYHIGYWLLNQYPLTKSSTHPSNIARPYLFKFYNDSSRTSLDELKHIIEDVKPEVIVSGSESLNFFPDNSSENQYFKESLNRNFAMIYKDPVDRIYIWEREGNSQ